MGYTNNSNHFRKDESELQYMTLWEQVVSFEGYKHQWDNERTLGPARGKREWAGNSLGIVEQHDFNSNSWFSQRYDFDKNGEYFDASMRDYPFAPHEHLRAKDAYMLWEPDAWKKHSDNWWSAKAIMEESVWKILTDPWNKKSAKYIKDNGLTQDDLNLETIYLYDEFETEEELNEAHKALRIKEYEAKIDRLQKLPYGVTR
jgi:hypothetical protein